MIGCIFSNNYATNGGGIYNEGTLINTKNVFINNTGGDIYPGSVGQAIHDANPASSRPNIRCHDQKKSFGSAAKNRPGRTIRPKPSMPRPLS